MNDGKPGGSPAGQAPLTKAQAEARAGELAGNTQFLNKLYSGDKGARAEMARVQAGLRLVDLNIEGGDAASAIEGVNKQIAAREVTERDKEINAILKVYDFNPATAQQLRDRAPVSQAEHTEVQRAFDRMRGNDDFMRKVRSGQEPEALRCFI